MVRVPADENLVFHFVGQRCARLIHLLDFLLDDAMISAQAADQCVDNFDLLLEIKGN